MYRFARLCFLPDTGTGASVGSGTDTTNGNGSQNTGSNQQTSNNQGGTAAPAIDYDKIQDMINRGTQQKENAILKSYFQQQGLSEEEARQAMETFRQQKAAQQPNITALQTQLAQAQTESQKTEIEKAAILEAVGMNMDAKSIPYLLKMADFSQAIGQDGKVNSEAIKTALNKVIEDIPALKPQTAGSTGFIQVGASGNSQTSAVDAELDKIFGVKK